MERNKKISCFINLGGRRFSPLPHCISTSRPAAAGLPGVLAAALCLLLNLACIPRLEVKPQTLAGRFAGQTAGGQAVDLSFREQQESFRGEGTLDGEPLVVAGAIGWRGVGSLQSAGGAEPIALTLSADGETVVVERLGQPALVLERAGDAAAPLPPGPFSGRFRALRGRAPLAEVTLVEGGALLSGVAIVTGDPVGITGRVVAPREAEGHVTFLDGSQAAFHASLAADGRTLVIAGFGDPVTLERRGAQ
jgi:hypothetical protein